MIAPTVARAALAAGTVSLLYRCGAAFMVRLSGLHPQEAKNLMSWLRVHIEPGDWITPKPLAESTIALITTAGLHRRHDPPFVAGGVDYRIIPGDVDFADIVSSQ